VGLAVTEVLHETSQMRITLSGAMRARDVSRPSDEQLAAAAKREEAADPAGTASRPGHAPSPAVPAVSTALTEQPPTAPARARPDDGPKPAPPRRRRRRRG
jgi:hypothetical protein